MLTPFAAQMSGLVPRPLQTLRRIGERTQPAVEDNTMDGARENIHRHYDLSNDLFSAVPRRDHDVLVGLVRARRRR